VVVNDPIKYLTENLSFRHIARVHYFVHTLVTTRRSLATSLTLPRGYMHTVIRKRKGKERLFQLLSDKPEMKPNRGEYMS
jgi:hypothetical protein